MEAAMITIEELKNVVTKQRKAEMRRDAGLERKIDFPDEILSTHALVLTGVRRCGKSTVMTQRIRRSSEPWFYMKFDAPALVTLELSDSVKMDSVIEETCARRLYLDEVHELEGWELFVLEKLDEGHRVCVTGSNASLLKGERASKLTGRHISIELFPFSYGEFLAYCHKKPGRASLEEYLEIGGFPRFVQTRDELHLLELFDDIVYRDVIVRHGIREVAAVKRLAAYLAENPGCRFSASKMLRPLGVSNASTVTQWCDWLEDAYLFFFVPKYSDSIRAQLVNPRKIYCVDTGMLQAVSTRTVFNDSLRFENLVFLALRQTYREIFYYGEEDCECDFIALRRHAAAMAVQSCVKLHSQDLDRELNGLRAAMSRFGLKEGWIITLEQADSFNVAEGVIHVVPFWKWSVSAVNGTGDL